MLDRLGVRRLLGSLIDRLRPIPKPIRPTLLSDVVSTDPELWSSSLEAAAGGPQVLIATSMGGSPAMTPVESMLGVALTLHGAHVHVFLCDGTLPACMECDIYRYPDPRKLVDEGPQADRCATCHAEGMRIFGDIGLDVHSYSDYLTAQVREQARHTAQTIQADEIENFIYEGLAVGEHAKAGALRYFARGDLASEPLGEEVLRRFFEAAILTAAATRGLIAATDLESSVFHHGIYVPQGIIGEALRASGVRVVNWNVAYRTSCFIFSHGDTYHHTLMNEPVDSWRNLEWSDEREVEALTYLKSRWHGSKDWIWFHESPETRISRIEDEIGIDFSIPTVGLLTNVVWDAQLHYPANAFPGLLEWLTDTIEYFAHREDVQLLIRIHPAEIRGTLKSRQPVLAEIQRHFPDLPKNVFVIPPESAVSTYAAMDQCDSVLIYGTKTGVELTAMGIPVVVAGEAWIRNKGITIDACNRDEYHRILDTLPVGRRLSEQSIELARKYAYHFFMRRMIPLTSLPPTGQWPPYSFHVASLAELMPGASVGLEIVCDGILTGTPFIYPAETLSERLS